MSDWDEHLAREVERYEDGEGRLPDDPDARQRQLTRMGNAAWGAGLCLLMAAASESDSENHSQVIALSGDPARAEADLVDLGERLGRRLGG